MPNDTNNNPTAISRTSTTSIPKYAAKPLHTPPSTPCCVSRMRRFDGLYRVSFGDSVASSDDSRVSPFSENSFGSPICVFNALTSSSEITPSFATPRSASSSTMRASISRIASGSACIVFSIAAKYFSSAFFASTSMLYGVFAKCILVTSFTTSLLSLAFLASSLAF